MSMNEKWSTRFELKPGKWVFVPAPDMIRLGQEIKSAVEKRWSAPPYFYHLRAGGHVAALRSHLANSVFVRLDIRNFFGSIGRSRVTRCLTSRFSHGVAREWAHMSTVRDPSSPARTIVPVGFVQSPIIASLCLADSALGSHLDALHRGRQVAVSVYVDDIILSAEKADALSDQVVDALRATARRSHFTFSTEKSQGPGAAIEAFNIDLCHGALRVGEGRMAEFEQALKTSASGPRRAGILSYIGTVNVDQHAEAKEAA